MNQWFQGSPLYDITHTHTYTHCVYHELFIYSTWLDNMFLLWFLFPQPHTVVVKISRATDWPSWATQLNSTQPIKSKSKPNKTAEPLSGKRWEVSGTRCAVRGTRRAVSDELRAHNFYNLIARPLGRAVVARADSLATFVVPPALEALKMIILLSAITK